jgi:hypothetical protein
MKLVCQWCGKEFESKVYRKFCSKQCRSEASQYYQHLYYLERIKEKKEWEGLQKYDREGFQQYQKQKDRTKKEGRMFWVIKNEISKNITFEKYLKDLERAIKYFSGDQICLNQCGVRIFMFLKSLIQAWQTVVPKEDQDVERVFRFLDAYSLNKTLQDMLTRFLNLENFKIAV